MKKSKIIIVVAAVVLVLVGGIVFDNIDYLFAPKSYKQQSAVFKKVNIGFSMTKQEVFEKLGTPESCAALKNGEWEYIGFAESKDRCNDSDVNRWVYTSNKMGDSDPYRLVVDFDSNGESTDATFDYIPGG